MSMTMDFYHRDDAFRRHPYSWGRTFINEDGNVRPVLRLPELIRHLEARPDYDGDLAVALDDVCAAPSFTGAPPTLVADILEFLGEVLPRTNPVKPGWGYDDARQPSGAARAAQARAGYDREVVERDAYRCRYCGSDLGSSYRDWLQLSVDRILPRKLTRRGYPAVLLDDVANLVTCCRTCSDFGSRDVVRDVYPRRRDDYFDLRDRVFLQRRARLARKHRIEERRYRAVLTPHVSAA